MDLDNLNSASSIAKNDGNSDSESDDGIGELSGGGLLSTSTIANGNDNSSSSSSSSMNKISKKVEKVSKKRVKTQKEIEEDEAYEKTAKDIAELVRRQQEGIESAMLSDEHKDKSLLHLASDVDALREEQITLMASKYTDDQSSSLSSKLYPHYFSRSSYYSRNNNDDDEDDDDRYKKKNKDEDNENDGSKMINEIDDSKNRASNLLGEWYTERSKFIPVRLSLKERKKLRFIQAVFRTSDYTNLVDGANFSSDMKRTNQILKCVRAILVGLISGFDFRIGKQCCENPEKIAEYKDFLSQCFEVTRRYKIMNPEKMRSEYGKMILFLQDTMSKTISEEIGFETVTPIVTVYEELSRANSLGALRSEWIATATMEILPDGKSRDQIQREIRAKNFAIDKIAKKFSNGTISADRIKDLLYSIADNSNFLNGFCRPIEQIVAWLKFYFKPEGIKDDDEWSLAIYGGENGANLTHSHERQYHYVLQSLTLWREIVFDMYRLWYLAEQDLLDKELLPYKLRDTGQGLHRMQTAPRTSKAMHGILFAVQQRLGGTQHGWVGSNVIHLGDDNVANALIFIDKYQQVSRILNPVVHCIKEIGSVMMKDQGLAQYINHAWGGPEKAIKSILHDFFRFAFDGSGGDDLFVAGSCIDGRLTSAWNWCNQLEKKKFFPLFKLSGFTSFDGEFQT